MWIDVDETIFYILCDAAVNGRTVDEFVIQAAGDVDINGTFLGQATPLFIAAAKGHVALVRQLLSSPNIDVNRPGTKNGSTPLFVAAEKGHVQVVEALLESSTIEVNKGLFSPLYVASQNGHVQVVKALLEHPDVVPSIYTNGHTPYSIAILNGHHEIADLLLLSI